MKQKREIVCRTGEKALTKGQVEVLLAKVGNVSDYALLTLALDTGIRREDIVKIKRADVNLNDSKITFYESKKKRTRTISLGDRAKQSLEMWLNINTRSKWLFPSKYGDSKHITGKTAYNHLNRYLSVAGLPKRPFHALRGTCYKLCQKAGWSVEESAKRLGDTVRVAQEHYATPSDEDISRLTKEKPII